MAKKTVKTEKTAAKKTAASKAAPKKSAVAPKKPVAPAKPVKSAAPKAAVKKAAVKQAPSSRKAAVPKTAAAPKKAAPKAAAVKKNVAKVAAAKPAAPKSAPKKAAAPANRASAKTVAARAGAVKAAAEKVAAARAARTTGKAPVKPVAKKGAKPAAPVVRAQAVHAPQPQVKIPEVTQPTGSYGGILLTENIKPFPKKTPYSVKEVEMLREELTRERDSLYQELSSLNSTSREVMDLSKEHPGYSLHMAEHATDLQTAEASLGVRSIVQDRLEQVTTALRRLEETPASFGLCLACGAKIGIQRLKARPHAHLCVTCRERYEKIRSRRGS